MEVATKITYFDIYICKKNLSGGRSTAETKRPSLSEGPRHATGEATTGVGRPTPPPGHASTRATPQIHRLDQTIISDRNLWGAPDSPVSTRRLPAWIGLGYEYTYLRN